MGFVHFGIEEKNRIEEWIFVVYLILYFLVWILMEDIVEECKGLGMKMKI